ncbi:hypothetical protein AB4564_19460 [Vibrio sp. 10N.222.51.E8]|uniref:hypothetical protein n=1 Tax=unclassified Vibrio TaxID=2614977 RepID=UPI0010BD8A98|nr:hypothetical protein [Vibrio sp. F13]TKG24312.1 hypothetical protein FCV85_22820 [Vibrio sp. F13]
MAQRHSTPTLSKLNSATNVSPLGRESSPKNDISLLRIPQRTEEEEHGFFIVKDVSTPSRALFSFHRRPF